MTVNDDFMSVLKQKWVIPRRLLRLILQQSGHVQWDMTNYEGSVSPRSYTRDQLRSLPMFTERMIVGFRRNNLSAFSRKPYPPLLARLKSRHWGCAIYAFSCHRFRRPIRYTLIPCKALFNIQVKFSLAWPHHLIDHTCRLVTRDRSQTRRNLLAEIATPMTRCD